MWNAIFILLCHYGMLVDLFRVMNEKYHSSFFLFLYVLSFLVYVSGWRLFFFISCISTEFVCFGCCCFKAIAYLQRTGLLPNLQDSDRFSRMGGCRGVFQTRVDDYQVAFISADAFRRARSDSLVYANRSDGNPENISLRSLVFGFFEMYSYHFTKAREKQSNKTKDPLRVTINGKSIPHFDFHRSVCSIRCGGILDRETKSWGSRELSDRYVTFFSHSFFPSFFLES